MLEGFEEYLAQIEHGLEDPGHVAVIKLTWSAGKWAQDDPRIEELAEEVAAHFIADPSLLPTLGGLRTRQDGDMRHDLLTHHGEVEGGARRIGCGRHATIRRQLVLSSGMSIRGEGER